MSIDRDRLAKLIELACGSPNDALGRVDASAGALYRLAWIYSLLHEAHNMRELDPARAADLTDQARGRAYALYIAMGGTDEQARKIGEQVQRSVRAPRRRRA